MSSRKRKYKKYELELSCLFENEQCENCAIIEDKCESCEVCGDFSKTLKFNIEHYSKYYALRKAQRSIIKFFGKYLDTEFFLGDFTLEINGVETDKYNNFINYLSEQ